MIEMELLVLAGVVVVCLLGVIAKLLLGQKKESSSKSDDDVLDEIQHDISEITVKKFNLERHKQTLEERKRLLESQAERIDELLTDKEQQ